MKNAFIMLVATVCLGYIALCLFMYSKQRHMQYQPKAEKGLPQDVGATAAQIINVTTEDGLVLEGWYFQPSPENKKVIVFFHGNGWVIGDAFHFAGEYLKHGYGLIMVEYRGYAGHAGRVTEQGLYADSRAYIDWLHTEKNIPHSDMVFYGESLGTAMAVKMASEYKAQAVVLLAPFTSFVDVAGQHYPYLPISLLLKDTYRNDEAIKKVNSPVLILHGKHDRLVNYKFGQELYDMANDPKKIIVFEEGSHVNMYDLGAHKIVRDFLSTLTSK